MKGENVCIIDGKQILRVTLVLLFIPIIWLNKISTLSQLYYTTAMRGIVFLSFFFVISSVVIWYRTWLSEKSNCFYSVIM